MKRNKNILACICTLGLSLFTSCENTIPFKTQDIPQKLIVNALIDATAEGHRILLDLTGTERTMPVADGEIDIYVNDIHKESIRELSESSEWGRRHEYISNCRFSPGDHVRLEARTKDGAHNAYAEITVPEPISIERIDTMSVSTNNYGSDYLRMKVTFTDNTQRTDFYRIAASHILTCYGKSQLTGEDSVFVTTTPAYLISREDVVLTEGQPGTLEDHDDFFFTASQNRYAVFDDSRINGTYTMTVSTPLMPYYYYYFPGIDIERLSLDIKVRLISLCEAEYYYLRALNVFDSDDYDEAFNPPVRFPSNINGGVGVVGISSETNRLINVFKEEEINPYYS